MSLNKKSIFSESKFGLQTLTPSYSKIKCQPLTETSQQTTAYFLKQNLSQNSNFLKNFKSKHLNSATPSVNSFVDQISEVPIHPFKVYESQDAESSDRNIGKIMINNECLRKENVSNNKNNSTTFSFDIMENSEELSSHKTIHNLNTPFCSSLSPSKGKNHKAMQGNHKTVENKEDKENKEKNPKIKLNFRKHSEIIEIKTEKEEFSASKNLLHSSVFFLFFYFF